MKMVMKVIPTILILLIAAINLYASEVVTIYFAGTSLTEDWWDADQAHARCGSDNWDVFDRPELVATLHHAQLDRKDYSALSNHHKYFVDGVCSGCPDNPVAMALSCSFASIPSDECRSWSTCLEEARVHLKGVLDETTCSIILNLVGLSRGGILTMMFAHDIQNNADLWSQEEMDRITQINILAFDPVAGEMNIPGLDLIPTFHLDGKVKNYVGIYATDERSFMFAPTIPSFDISVNDWMIRVPGSHETMVGNTQWDGHATWQAGHNFPLIPNTSYCPDEWASSVELCYDYDELKKVANVVKTISVYLLQSSQWGEVQFNWSRLIDDWNGKVYGASEFIAATEEMWNYPHYRTMRLISSVSLIDNEWLSGYESYCYFAGNYYACIYDWPDWFVFKGYDNDRVAIESRNKGNSWSYVSLENTGDIRQLTDGARAWWYLQELVNKPGPVTPPNPNVDPLPILNVECSEEISEVPIATGSCLETILGTTKDPLTYSEQGTYSITWTYGDGSEEIVGQKQTVVVEDRTPPQLTVPTSKSIECEGNSGQAVNIGTASAIDNCCEVIITNNAPPLFQLGETEVLWTATDCNGNSTTASQTITVEDTTPPDINLSLNPDILWPPNHKMAHVTATVISTDICHDEPTIDFVSIIINESDEKITFDPNYDNSASVNQPYEDIQIIDDYNFYLRSERSGNSEGRIYAIIYKAVDASGNESSVHAEVSVPHNM